MKKFIAVLLCLSTSNAFAVCEKEYNKINAIKAFIEHCQGEFYVGVGMNENSLKINMFVRQLFDAKKSLQDCLDRVKRNEEKQSLIEQSESHHAEEYKDAISAMKRKHKRAVKSLLDQHENSEISSEELKEQKETLRIKFDKKIKHITCDYHIHSGRIDGLDDPDYRAYTAKRDKKGKSWGF